MPKLHEILAVEKGNKTRIYTAITDLHKHAQKADPFNGFSKDYRPKDEDGDKLPPERKKVVLSAPDVLTKLAALIAESFDVTATKDAANRNAVADVVLDGKVLLKDMPATYLIFLEKQLIDVRTFVEKMPVLDEATDWTPDLNTGMFRSGEVVTHRSEKQQKPLVLFPATPEHPAQTQIITQDVIVGFWHSVKHSGAFPAPRKQEILIRVNTLLDAVKQARERANMVEAPSVKVGGVVFDYLFK